MHSLIGPCRIGSGDPAEAKSALSRCDFRSVGLIVRAGRSVLLIRRNSPPFGFAAPAGHVDRHGQFVAAARRELEEEVGLTAENLRPVYRAMHRNACRRCFGRFHYWVVYRVDRFAGEVKASAREVKSVHWVERSGLTRLADRTRRCLKGRTSPGVWRRQPGLEPIWVHIFTELGLI